MPGSPLSVSSRVACLVRANFNVSPSSLYPSLHCSPLPAAHVPLRVPRPALAFRLRPALALGRARRATPGALRAAVGPGPHPVATNLRVGPARMPCRHASEVTWQKAGVV